MLARGQHLHHHHHHHHHHYHHHRTHQAASGPALMEPAAIEASDLASAFPAAELIGRQVHNDMGETIGLLDDLLLDGMEAPYAVLSVGDFLGSEARQVVVAYHDLSLAEQRLVLPGADREALMRMLVYERTRAAASPALRSNGTHANGVAETAFHEAVPGLVAHITDGEG